MSNQAFWFVWNEGGDAPRHKHPSFGSASDEAERLAKLHRGQTFVVLQSVVAMLVSDVQRIDLRPADDDIPF
jgi:hypothetical protein